MHPHQWIWTSFSCGLIAFGWPCELIIETGEQVGKGKERMFQVIRSRLADLIWKRKPRLAVQLLSRHIATARQLF